jgi:hypothetical protein
MRKAPDLWQDNSAKSQSKPHKRSLPLHNRKIARVQGQIETALINFRANLELRLKELFAVLHIQSHLMAPVSANARASARGTSCLS